MIITQGNLLQQQNIARVEIGGTLKILQRFFLLSLATQDVAFQLEYLGVIRYRLAGDSKFSQSTVVVDVSAIEVFSAREMCLACIWTKAKCGLESCFGPRQTSGRMIIAKMIKAVMGMSQLAICFEERWVTSDSLIQQICSLQQILSSANMRARR